MEIAVLLFAGIICYLICVYFSASLLFKTDQLEHVLDELKRNR